MARRRDVVVAVGRRPASNTGGESLSGQSAKIGLRLFFYSSREALKRTLALVAPNPKLLERIFNRSLRYAHHSSALSAVSTLSCSMSARSSHRSVVDDRPPSANVGTAHRRQDSEQPIRPRAT